MAYVLSLLPFLACPLMMGLMMWLMMRGDGKGETNQSRTNMISTPSESPKPATLAGLHLCLNWKVVGGLALVGVGIWIVTPNLIWAALPVLVVLACPLSMLFMMRGMGGGQCAVQPEQEQQLPLGARTHEEELAALRTQHVAISREIAELEVANGSASRDTEMGVRGPRERVADRG